MSRTWKLLAVLFLSLGTAGLGALWAIRPAGVHTQDSKRFAHNRAEKRLRRLPSERAQEALTRFNSRHGGQWQIRFDPRTGALSSLEGGATGPRAGRPQDVSAAFLREAGDLISVDPSALSIQKQISDGGLSHILYTQSYRGLPVEFSRVKVHMAADGSIIGVNSSFEPDLSLDIDPSLTSSQAFQSVRAELGDVRQEAGSLVIFPDEQSGRARLAWKYAVRRNFNLWNYYVDAHTGQVLFRFDDLRHQACVTSGVVSGMVYDINPTSTPARAMPFANARVYVKDVSSAVTNTSGFYCSTEKGKVIASLQGPYVNVSNFSGPSAHYDNGSGVWSTIGTFVASAHPYLNNSNVLNTVDLSAIAPLAVKVLPIFSSFDVGGFGGGEGDSPDITDDDQVTVLDSAGHPVGGYIGDRGSFNGAAAHGKSYSLRLRSNASGQHNGFEVAVSSYLTLSAPGEWNVSGSSVFWRPEYTATGKRAEINLFYHMNAMHDYFMRDVNISSVAYIGNPVNVIAMMGPSFNGAFYSPDYDNISFGDIDAAQVSDALTDDATVPRHEYTHYVVQKIWPIQNWGQAGAISEAVADYFSASSLNESSIGHYYNTSLGPPGGALRELDCPTKKACQVYSASTWNGEIHDDSVFLSQALWEIRKARVSSQGSLALGQSCADGLVFKTLQFFPESFAEFYDAIRRVDSLGLVANCNPGNSAANAAQAAITAAFSLHGLPGASGDAYERNDGFETAVDISTRGIISATIYPAVDADFYAFGAGAGDVTITLTLPAAGGSFYKAYALTLFDRNHNPLGTAQPAYNGINTVAGENCALSDCTTTQEKVTLVFSTNVPNYYYLRVSGGPVIGDLLNGSNSGVNSTVPYSLEFQYNKTGAAAASIVTATYDQDTIGFTVNVTSFTSLQNFSFACAQLRDQSLSALPDTLAVLGGGSSGVCTPGAASWLTAISSESARGVVSGALRLNTGFAARFPSVGTVHVEVFGYNVLGSTVSLGLSQPLNLTTNAPKLTAWNNVFNPLLGQKTTIKYDIIQPGRVKIQLFTLSGSLVKTLVDEEMTSGKGSADWNGKNSNGTPVANGVYLLHMRGPGVSKTQKIVVVK